MEYLTNIPDQVKEYGFCKNLAVRKEVIHLKHILTEIFVRKTINIEKELSKIGYTLFDYIQEITNRLRRIHHFTRLYENNPNHIVKSDRDRFFPTIKLLKGLSVVIVLDFDGVVTENSFKDLYNLCHQRANVHICSANPTVTNEWFLKRNLPLPSKIHSMKGKVKKIKRLIELQRKYDYIFFVDNEIEYLNYAWLFGIQTYHYTDKVIKYYSRKTK